MVVEGPWGCHAESGGVVSEGRVVVGARRGEGEPRPVVQQERWVRRAHPQLWPPGAAVALAHGAVISEPAQAGWYLAVRYTGVGPWEDEAVAVLVGDVSQVVEAPGG